MRRGLEHLSYEERLVWRQLSALSPAASGDLGLEKGGPHIPPSLWVLGLKLGSEELLLGGGVSHPLLLWHPSKTLPNQQSPT